MRFETIFVILQLNERSGECDFVVCKNNKVLQAIQVSYDISAEKTRKREVNGLLMAARVTGCENLLLLTDHESEEIEQEGHKMRVQPVYEWCGEVSVGELDGSMELFKELFVRLGHESHYKMMMREEASSSVKS